ncbi:MAG: electron transport complex subunit E [Gammaproteobacteria bacterium]|nr:electron transport complex subunit E [Gammaproteobacteria bacterium]
MSDSKSSKDNQPTKSEVYKNISFQGLWKNNPVLVQMLGLCPLLAVSNTVINALGLGLATMLVLVISNACVSSIRHIVRQDVRLPVFVLIIASAVTITELSMKAWFFELYQILGIFIPLIVTNCAIVARAESFASKNSILPSIYDGLMMGLGFTLVLVTLGAIREIIGMGTLFSHVELMFGEQSSWVTLQLFDDYQGFLLAILPPGAFIGLALILATKNYIEIKNKKTKKLSFESNQEVEP